MKMSDQDGEAIVVTTILVGLTIILIVVHKWVIPAAENHLGVYFGAPAPVMVWIGRPFMCARHPILTLVALLSICACGPYAYLRLRNRRGAFVANIVAAVTTVIYVSVILWYLFLVGTFLDFARERERGVEQSAAPLPSAPQPGPSEGAR
jgi:hypothetical protein